MLHVSELENLIFALNFAETSACLCLNARESENVTFALNFVETCACLCLLLCLHVSESEIVNFALNLWKCVPDVLYCDIRGTKGY